MTDTSFCSQIARSHDVSLAGTATEATDWLLIEDPSPWGHDAVADADWFPDVQATLTAWEEALPQVRVQLIRRGIKQWDTPGYIRCVAIRTGHAPVVRTWALDAYADLEALDVPAALRSPSSEAIEAPIEEPLILTCTNGRRDACCAKWGRPVAQSVADLHPAGAWQTSHLGGHRFAPTVLVLPSGVQYGWLAAEDMPDVVEAHRNGTMYDLDRVRGRVFQPRPVQAACLALRRRLHLRAIDVVRGTCLSDTPPWRVRVRTSDRIETAHVRRVERDAAFRHSCRTDETTPCVEWAVTWM